MNHRPYPDRARALAQLKRRRLPEPTPPVLAWIDEHLAPGFRLTDWQRQFAAAFAGLAPKKTGRTAVTTALAAQAVKAGEHVHVAGTDGIRCAGGDDTCPTPSLPTDRA